MTARGRPQRGISSDTCCTGEEGAAEEEGGWGEEEEGYGEEEEGGWGEEEGYAEEGECAVHAASCVILSGGSQKALQPLARHSVTGRATMRVSSVLCDLRCAHAHTLHAGDLPLTKDEVGLFSVCEARLW